MHDGDTVHLDIDVGFDIHLVNSPSCRVYGINAPELGTTEGIQSLAFAKSLLDGQRVLVTSHGWDKYGGRFDGSIILPDGRDFAQAMIDAGQAVPMEERT